MKNIYDKFMNYLKSQYFLWLFIFVVILISICVASISSKDRTVKCDNEKAIKLLKEQNINDLTQAADNTMIRRKGDYYKIVFSDKLNNDELYDGEFAKLRYGSNEEKDIIKASYDKAQAFTENVNKDINEVVCTVPVTFSNFSTKSRKSTLSGVVSYTIHANDKGNLEVNATSIANMFTSNLHPIYNRRQHKYHDFVYITGNGNTIKDLNDIPLEEFGEFFNPLDF